MKAQLSEAERASRIKTQTVMVSRERGRKGGGDPKVLQFQVWFRSENNEAVNQVKAKLLKDRPRQNAPTVKMMLDLTNHVDLQYDISFNTTTPFFFLYFVIAWLAT